MKTAVVILNYNGRSFLEKFLPALISSMPGRQQDIIIADNASSDTSIEFLSQTYPDMRVISMDRNYGFAEGYNRALEQIEADNYLLLNSDVEVPSRWLEPLEKWLDDNPDCAACGPKLLSYNDKTMFEYAGAAGGYMDKYGFPLCRGRVIDKLEEDKGQYDENHDVMWVSGACLMIRSKAWKQAGGFDKRFFAHQEEIDLCWRLSLLGYRICVVPASKVYHVGGGCLPKGAFLKIKLNYRNNILMLSKNLCPSLGIKFFYDTMLGMASVNHRLKNPFKQCYKTFLALPKDEARQMMILSFEDAHFTANRILSQRKIIDVLSCLVYLLKRDIASIKAVRQAYKEYRKMKSNHDIEELVNTYCKMFVNTKGKMAENFLIFDGEFMVKGWYRGSVIFDSLRKKKINLQ